MEMSVSSETTFFNMKLQLKICPQLRTGSSAEDRGRIDTVLWYRLHTGAEAHALILVGCRVLTPQRLTTPRFAFFLQPTDNPWTIHFASTIHHGCRPSTHCR